MTTKTSFALAFDPALIAVLASQYGYRDETKAFEAGARIKGGDYSRQNLQDIFEWKTKGRGRSRLGINSDEEIADALRLAKEAKTERAAIAVLTGLAGVLVPVASAVMTTINIDRYTIIDFRALTALSVGNTLVTVPLYLDYLDYCRHLARQHSVSLRILDRALWAWPDYNAARTTGASNLDELC